MASLQSTSGSRGVRISGSNAGYTMFRGSVKSTGYPLHSPVSPFTSPTRASLCAVTFQLDCTCGLDGEEEAFLQNFVIESSWYSDNLYTRLEVEG